MDLHRLRLAHLGATLVVTDFYIQIPQILEELRHVSALSADSEIEDEEYASPTATHRYGTRLVDWWYLWYYQDSDLDARQVIAHNFLKQTLVAARHALDAEDAEQLKIELWLRWHPENTRDLALWATSVGTISDSNLMRKGRLEPNSDIVAVRAFTTGSPSFYETETAGRWKSYLALPVWFQHGSLVGETLDAEEEELAADYSIEMVGGSVPVGVICISSMLGSDKSSISQQKRRNTVETLAVLEDAAQQLISSSAGSIENIS